MLLLVEHSLMENCCWWHQVVHLDSQQAMVMRCLLLVQHQTERAVEIGDNQRERRFALLVDMLVLGCLVQRQSQSGEKNFD